MKDREMPPPPPQVSKEHRELFERFASELPSSAATGSNELVEVTINGLFEVTEVKLAHSALQSGSPHALEEAIQSAINSAIREIARRNAERLTGPSTSRS